ncbi:MAG TPA: PilZ domain-containing protein [Planctomycetota bacterium]
MADSIHSSKQRAAERRQHERVTAADLPFKLDRSQGPLRIRDISNSGIAFYSESEIPVMTQVRFAFETTGESGAEFSGGEGVVVRCEQISPALAHYEIALFFTELQPKARKFLDNFIVKRMESTRS